MTDANVALENEVWLPVAGYESAYLVSNLGRVKSLPKPRCTFEKILKPCHSGTSGYLGVFLGDGTTIKRPNIHRLVAMAFHPNPENKEQVNHIDGNKHNNRADNLEWSTRSENQKHSITTGLRSAKGSKNSQVKLLECEVRHIRALLSQGEKRNVIAEMFSVSYSTVCNIHDRKSWTHI